MSASRREHLIKVIIPWLSNWVSVVLLYSLALVFNKLVSPFQRPFSIYDLSIVYPYTEKETINDLWLWIISLVIPISILILIYIKHRSIDQVHNSVLGLLWAVGLASVITQITKCLTGRLRPDFLDRCQPSLSTNSTILISTLLDQSECTRTDLLHDGALSFFSGHAAISFSGLGFLSIYLAYQFKLFQYPYRVYKTWTWLAPLLVAWFISVSRIRDFRHHWEDVLVGIIVGLAMAIYVFVQIFILNTTTKPPLRPQISFLTNNQYLSRIL